MQSLSRAITRVLCLLAIIALVATSLWFPADLQAARTTFDVVHHRVSISASSRASTHAPRVADNTPSAITLILPTNAGYEAVQPDSTFSPMTGGRTVASTRAPPTNV